MIITLKIFWSLKLLKHQHFFKEKEKATTDNIYI